MIQNNNTDVALKAIMETPAFDRVLECISISFLLNSLSCEYTEEANALLERFGLENIVSNTAKAKLDVAYDNYFDVMNGILNTEDRKELNLSSEILKKHIESLLAE